MVDWEKKRQHRVGSSQETFYKKREGVVVLTEISGYRLCCGGAYQIERGNGSELCSLCWGLNLLGAGQVIWRLGFSQC